MCRAGRVVCNSPLLYSHSQSFSVDQLLNEHLVKLPTSLDSLFHKVVNTTSTPIGMEVVGSHGVAGI